MPAGRSSSSTRARRTRSPWRSARRCRFSWRSESSTRPAAARRHAARRSDPMAEPERTDQEWALQRRLEDVFAKLGEKFGDLTGRVETKMRSTVTFDDVGGLRQAKTGLKGFALALSNPDLYRQWGIDPPKGVLLYGPPGTGKTKLAQAVATASSAIFYHLKLMNLTSKFGANTGDLLQEILRIAMAEGPAVLFLDEAEALSLEHLLPPPQAREASARLVAALCEKLDALSTAARILVVAATTHTDALDPALVAPGRLDHLIEIPLPDPGAQKEILELVRVRTEKNAGRPSARAPRPSPPRTCSMRSTATRACGGSSRRSATANICRSLYTP